MATISIRKRQDPIVVSNERARQVKLYKFGSHDKKIAPQPPDALIDLVEWSGELRLINAIELDRHDRSEGPVAETDVAKFNREIAKFKTRKMKARPGSKYEASVFPEDLYALSLRLVAIDIFGEVSIRDPRGYRHFRDIAEEAKKRRDKQAFAKSKELESAEETFKNL